MKFKDHTGKEIKPGQKATMDAEHAHCDDWKGCIIEKTVITQYFKYDDDGDEVEITTDLAQSIEIQPPRTP